MSARVATAAETAACERATIESGTPAGELMRRAGFSAAQQVASHYAPSGARVVVMTGPGNNGGDGWIVARSLADRGLHVTAVETSPPRTADAIEARGWAVASSRLRVSESLSAADMGGVIIDALLGTGASGKPRGAAAAAIREINAARLNGSRVVSLDLPSGLDPTTGEHEECVRADATVSFGTAKRGQLLARDVCGEIVIVDIGLRKGPELLDLPLMVDHGWVHSRIPRIPVTAHKGTRKRVAIIGGAKGMAGAAILAGEGALRAGVGLLRLVVSRDSVLPVHAGIPAATVSEWPDDPADLADLTQGFDAVALGPGLGRSDAARDLVERVLHASDLPVVLDADALNVFQGDVPSLATLFAGRDAILTPHPLEAARLLAVPGEEILADPFDACARLARGSGAAVLLKGVPTLVFAPGGRGLVVSRGTAALATGGSGDVLTGATCTLLAQMSVGNDRAITSAACAAFIHGRAAELCGLVRGVTLDDVLQAFPRAWNEDVPAPEPAVLARLGRLA